MGIDLSCDERIERKNGPSWAREAAKFENWGSLGLLRRVGLLRQGGVLRRGGPLRQFRAGQRA